MGQRKHIHRKDVTVRMAQDEDAPVLAELTKDVLEFNEWEPTWEHVHPHWLIADYQGKPMACIQICHGRPFFRIEILGVRSEIPKRLRAFVVQKITDACLAVAAEYGAEAVCSVIPFELPQYRKVAKRQGWVTMATGNLVMKRCR